MMLDVSKNVKGIIEKLQVMRDAPIEDFSEIVTNFYQAMCDRIHTKAMYRGKNNASSNNRLEMVCNSFIHSFND